LDENRHPGGKAGFPANCCKNIQGGVKTSPKTEVGWEKKDKPHARWINMTMGKKRPPSELQNRLGWIE